MYQYIGVTDFKTCDQVDEAHEVLTKHMPHHCLLVLHAGIMTSKKVLIGAPTRWAEVWPRVNNIPKILSHPNVYNCVHYADYEGVGEPSDDQFEYHMTRIGAFGGPFLRAVQLDMTWPDSIAILRGMASLEDMRRTLEWKRSVTQECETIVQIGRKALELINFPDRPQLLSHVIAGYCSRLGSLRFLLDKSVGKGISMDVSQMQRLLKYATRFISPAAITVAGGLCAENMYLMNEIWAKYPDVSIDMQGKMRKSGDVMDPIDMGLVKESIIAACETRAQYGPGKGRLIEQSTF